MKQTGCGTSSQKTEPGFMQGSDDHRGYDESQSTPASSVYDWTLTPVVEPRTISDAVERETRVLATLRRRAEIALPRQFTNAELIKVTIGAALRAPTEAYGVLFGYRLAKAFEQLSKEDSQTCASLAILPEEYEQLFGAESVTTDTKRLAAMATNEWLSKHAARLQTALSTSLISSSASSAWRLSRVRVAAVVSLWMRADDESLKAVVGDVVRSDLRRVQELQYDVQDEEDASDAHILPLCEAINALAEAVSV